MGSVGGGCRALWLVLLVVVGQFGLMAWPAHACGCGGMVPADGSHIAVDREVSAVRWDGRTERIVMSLTVSGDAPEAAWIMPVPSRATVALGDREVFGALRSLTAPVTRTRTHYWPQHGDWPFDETDGAASAAPPGGSGPGVGVVGRQRLGPFDVARLTATDPGALSGWLKKNGFVLPQRLSRELRPYTALAWEYVAVKLVPQENGQARELGGELEPLQLSFASDELIYPMRLSRAARQPQSLDLYVLAEHRMEPRDAIGGGTPQTTYAGKVGPGGAIGELADGKDFLTAFEQYFPQPDRINADHVLRRADSDASFQRVRYQDKLLKWAGVPAWLVTVGGALAVAVSGTVALVRRRRARAVLL